jgi:hypothetical protein
VDLEKDRGENKTIGLTQYIPNDATIYFTTVHQASSIQDSEQHSTQIHGDNNCAQMGLRSTRKNLKVAF